MSAWILTVIFFPVAAQSEVRHSELHHQNAPTGRAKTGCKDQQKKE